jgi:hypothetical protein
MTKLIADSLKMPLDPGWFAEMTVWENSHVGATNLVDVHQNHLDIMPISEVVSRIVSLNEGLRDFWSDAVGWAPIDAAHLLSKSRLDWQVSLSKCLNLWLEKCNADEEDGRLILAWTNLGSLTEGSLKLFLSVWYRDYRNDVDAIKRKGQPREPDYLTLEPMRQFFKKKIWDNSWDKWIEYIQHRRNAIHAFKDRDLGTFDGFYSDVRIYLRLLRYINYRLPYPDNETYRPRE